MSDLRNALAAAQRARLLRYLASAIHGFTIMARDPDMPGDQKAMINNRIHYLSGHLRSLTDPAEPLTEGRLDDVVEQIASLNQGLAEKIKAELVR
jgi:ribosomal protein S15P/S13E